MPTRLIGLLCGGLFCLFVPTALAAEPFDVSIRVEGKSRTLVKQRTVTLADAPVIKDGDPAHSCSGQAAVGALQAGTGGDWTGPWYEGLGYSAAKIMGHTPAKPGYFELWVNHRFSTTGLCETKLSAGDDVLMFVQDCTFDPKLERCKDPVTPLGVRVAKTIQRNRVRTVRVVDYSPAGKTSPERGAAVFVNGRRVGRTDAKGRITIKAKKTGVATIHATDRDHARSETVRVRVVR